MYKFLALPAIFLLIAILSAFLNLPFIFVLFFALLCYSPIIIGVLMIGLKMCDLVKLGKRKFIESIIVSVVYIVLFICARFVINKYYMPDSLSYLRVAVKLLFLICSFTMIWRFVSGSSMKVTIVCAIGYLLFIVIGPLLAVFKVNERAIEPQSIQKILKTIGYVGWAPSEDIQKTNITIYDPNLAYDGYNLTSSRTPYIKLVDMNGKVVHTWISQKKSDECIYAEMLDNGDLLTFSIDRRFIKMDWDSNQIWESKFRAHHDFHICSDGTIYALTRKDSVVFCNGLPTPILEDYIVVMSADGEHIKDINVFNSINDEYSITDTLKVYLNILAPKNIIEAVARRCNGQFIFKHDKYADIIHLNTVEVLEKDIPNLGSAGDILISAREIDLIGILNPESQSLVWKWGPGIISNQHRPTVLDDNTVMLFDNGYSKGFSRILIVDPLTKEIIWSYNNEGDKDFYSSRSGVSQKLPNGNILITQTQTGRGFEVNENGDIVWEYFNPNVNEKTNEREIVSFITRQKLTQDIIDKLK